jgi:hypothetical protein
MLCALAFPNFGNASEGVGSRRVTEAIQSLDRWLAASPYRVAWQSYLRVDVLRRQLADPAHADLDQLAGVLARFSADKSQLRLAPVVRLRNAVESWLVLSSLPDGQHLATVAERIVRRTPAGPDGRAVPSRLTALLLLLKEYAHHPEPRLADAIGDNLQWLARVPDAEPMVTAVRQYYGQPNIWIDISEAALVQAVESAIDREAAVSDQILGTAITGRARTRATTRLAVVPHREQARMTLTVTGTIDSQTVGSNGPARIHNRSLVRFRAEKKIVLDALGMRASPAVCTAETNTYAAEPTAVVPGVRGWVVRRVAARRVRRLRGQADEIASRHAERRIATLIDREADEQLREISQLAIDPLMGLAGGDRSRLRFSSAAGVLRIGAIAGPLGAPPHTATFARQHPYSLRLHSTLLMRLRNHPLADVAVASLGLGDGLANAVAWVFPTARTAARGDAKSSGGGWRTALAQVAGAQPTIGAQALTAQPIFYRLELDRLLGGWLNWAFDPRIGEQGIALRQGQLGTLSPVGLASDWPTMGWSPPAAEPRLALDPPDPEPVAR